MTAYDDSKRGSGRTTRQMQAAAKGALWISCNASCARGYDRHLARKLGREDLVLLSPDDVFGRSHRLLAMRPPEVVVDHALFDVDRRKVMDRLHAVFGPMRVKITTDVPPSGNLDEAALEAALIKARKLYPGHIRKL